MSDLHQQPIRYDLACLRKIITEASPDLLCAEITREDWERTDLRQASVEIREALAPIIEATDIVLIPVIPTPEQFPDFTPAAGWRRRLVQTLNQIFRWGQIQANDPDTINGLWFSTFCHAICWITELFWTREARAAWEKQNRLLAENIVHAVQRDSGRRVLVAVQCPRLHRLIRILHAHNDLFQIVPYKNL
jgi:hypothetical protein